MTEIREIKEPFQTKNPSPTYVNIYHIFLSKSREGRPGKCWEMRSKERSPARVFQNKRRDIKNPKDDNEDVIFQMWERQARILLR